MSFSKGIPKGKVLDEEKGEFDGYRGDDEVRQCMYPSCRDTKILRTQDAVFWDGITIPDDEFEFNLSPMAKLTTRSHPKIYSDGKTIKRYYVTMAMHAGCAAEWGMHLIKDSLQSHNVGTKLRQERPQNAIRKQT
jgi:hypothetical protein